MEAFPSCRDDTAPPASRPDPECPAGSAGRAHVDTRGDVSTGRRQRRQEPDAIADGAEVVSVDTKTLAPTAVASSSCRDGGTKRSRDVTTLAVGQRSSPSHGRASNLPSAWIASTIAAGSWLRISSRSSGGTAESRVARRSSGRAHLRDALAGGVNRIDAATPVASATPELASTRTVPPSRTTPDRSTRDGCRRRVSKATGPPIE